MSSVVEISSTVGTERLRGHGVQTLSDAELLALLLSGESVSARARTALSNVGGLRGLSRLGTGQLAETLGDPGDATRFASAMELCRRALATPLSPEVPITSSQDVIGAFGPRLRDLADEHVVLVLLDGRHQPLAERWFAHGGPSACPVGIREIFALAVREGAGALVLVHNHPSGDPTPSHDDVSLTRSLLAAGRLLDLPLLDHVIVARKGSFSFLDAGLLGSDTNAARAAS